MEPVQISPSPITSGDIPAPTRGFAILESLAVEPKAGLPAWSGMELSMPKETFPGVIVAVERIAAEIEEGIQE